MQIAYQKRVLRINLNSIVPETLYIYKNSEHSSSLSEPNIIREHPVRQICYSYGKGLLHS